MKTVIIYDSFFGNTEQLARAMGTALSATVVKVADAKPEQLAGAELIIVGSPTRGFRPSPAMKVFLKALPAGSLHGVRVTAFDTRVSMQDKVPGILKFLAGIFGYAAAPLSKDLVKKGGTLALAPEGFIVTTAKEPQLADGELERAIKWAQAL